jgi:hypothetical protein
LQLAWIGLLLVALALAAGCSAEPETSAGLEPVKPGTLALTVAGVPEGSAPAITLSGPGGYSRPVSGTESIGNLTPGTYTLAAGALVADGDRYTPSTPTQSIAVKAGPANTPARIDYEIVTGRLAVSVTGVD